jgi:hypothetical protein
MSTRRNEITGFIQTPETRPEDAASAYNGTEQQELGLGTIRLSRKQAGRAVR